MRKVIILSVFLCVGLYTFAQADKRVEKINHIIAQCEKQMDYSIALYYDQVDSLHCFPREVTDGVTRMVHAWDWTSGFYPGSLWYMYELTGNKKWLPLAQQYTNILEPIQNETRHHDTGFMMYCSYGNGLRITGNKNYEPILLQTSESLGTRFNPTVGCTRSWSFNQEEWDFPVIIDNMMNLEMLCWASQFSGDDKYINMAIAHANTTMKNHFRADNSSYHVVDYNPEDGRVNLKQTNQGYGDETAWARGQAWGLYGYTIMYRFTKDANYLAQAEKIADFILSHPNRREDLIPYWDYNAPNIPNEPRDASAAAITASALFELQQYSDQKVRFYSAANKIMTSLSSPEYFASVGTNNGFLLMHTTGNWPKNIEIDCPMNYADYYFLEALGRWKNTLEPEKLLANNQIKTLTDDGAWCWFSGPRAIYLHGDKEGVLTGWVKNDGSIEAGLLSSNTTAEYDILAPQLDNDDHANPAFMQNVDGSFMTFYTKHFDTQVRYHNSSAKSDDLFDDVVSCDPFSAAELEKFPLKRTTYANPFVLKEEGGKVFCFGRWTGFKPNMMVSEDGGKTFDKARVIITNYPFDSENRPYVKYYSNGNSRIHLTFTDGHPRNEPTNSVYYAYYENGAFYKANGKMICTVEDLPFEPKDATLVYKANKKKGKSWVFDISADANDRPVILYARYPDDEHHLYHRIQYNGKNWEDGFICNSGPWFPQTQPGKVEREPNYSGALVAHPLDANRVFVSEKRNGVFEIAEYKTSNDGKTWIRKAITENSKYDNVRPIVPQGMKAGDPTVVLWMQNKKYVHYTDYDCVVKYIITK